MVEPDRPSEVWASGDAYERYIGRWSRPVARAFLDWLAVPSGDRWLDVGCGTGALSWTILGDASPALVAGIDSSQDYVAYASTREPSSPGSFTVGDAQSLPFVDGSFDVAVSGLMLNFLPAPDRAVHEMARVARPGGTVAVYVWDYTVGMQLIRHFWDAAIALNPGARHLDEGMRFPLCQPGPLSELFHAAGLDNVQMRAVVVPTVFRDFDDYWSPFLGGQGPAPGYAMSLVGPQRAELQQRLRDQLPVEPDGSIHLAARAWAVRGTRASSV